MKPIVHLLTALFISIILPSTLFAQSESDHPADREFTKFETSLLGKWYFAGDANRVAYFVKAGSSLFFINEVKDAAEMKVTGSNTLVGTRPNYKASFIVIGDYMMCSNSFWWSRNPVNWISE